MIWLLLAASLFSKTPNSGLEEAEIELGGVRIKVELAKTPEQQRTGLMHRSSLASDRGMLFVFPAARFQHFWMKNTFIALDAGFFDEKFRLINVESMDPVKSEAEIPTRNYSSQKPARYVLEVNRGWFQQHKVKPGAKLRFIRQKNSQKKS